MKPELCDKEVLAMYDVRGIQSYIFKSNAAKEIIGASKLVEKIVTEGLQEYINTGTIRAIQVYERLGVG